MKRFSLLAIAVMMVIGVPAAANAVQAYSTANVNMRSGPSTRYPPVIVIPFSSRVEIYGCMRTSNWCDVGYRGVRGWVSGNYLQVGYSQRRVYVGPRYYEPLGIPTVAFSIGPYWDRYYRDRDFYRDRDEWRDGYYRPPIRRDNYRLPPPPPRWNNDSSYRPAPPLPQVVRPESGTAREPFTLRGTGDPDRDRHPIYRLNCAPGDIECLNRR